MDVLFYILASLHLLFCLYIVYLEYTRQSPGLYLWGIIAAIWGFPHFFSCVYGDPLFTNDTLLTCSIFSIIFMLFYFLARTMIPMSRKKLFANYEPKYDKKIAFAMLLILIIFSIIRIREMSQYSGGLMDATWALNHEMSSGENETSFFGQLYGKTSYFLSGVFLIFLVNKKKLLAAISCVVLVVTALMSRARADLLPVLICVITYYLFFKKVNPIKQMIKIGVLGFLAIYFVYALQMYRWQGSLNDFILNTSFWEFNELVFMQMTSGDGELGLSQYFYHFVQHDNNFEAFGQGHTYLRMLLFWIPTQWSFGLKPDDFAMAMGKACGMDEGGTMHPSLLGDCWANLGFLGVLLGYFWGVFVSMTDKFVNIIESRFQLPIYVTIACSFTLIGRGSVYNGFTFMIYICILIYWMQILSHKSFKRKHITYLQNEIEILKTV